MYRKLARTVPRLALLCLSTQHNVMPLANKPPYKGMTAAAHTQSHTLDTEPLHFQFPPTKNLRSSRAALDVKARTAGVARDLVFATIEDNMIDILLAEKSLVGNRGRSHAGGYPQGLLGNSTTMHPESLNGAPVRMEIQLGQVQVTVLNRIAAP